MKYILGKIVFCAVIVIFIWLALWIDFHWTKASLEDLTGKEVSNSTVIWTMLKTNGRK